MLKKFLPRCMVIFKEKFDAQILVICYALHDFWKFISMRFEFWNAWMHSKLSSEKKFISMNLGSIIEWEEKRYVVVLMRTTRRRKWRKESEYPEPRSAVGIYSKNPCASSMVLPFERVIWNFNQLKLRFAERRWPIEKRENKIN